MTTGLKDGANTLDAACRTQILLSILISGLFVMFVLAIFPRAYGFTSDVGIVLCIRENIQAPYISAVLSRFLSKAYGLSREIPWYALYVYGLLVLTLAVILKVLFSKKAETFSRWITVAFFLASYVGFVSQATFTSVSILVGSVACLAYLHGSYSRAYASIGLAPLLFGLMLALSYMTRMHGVVAVIALMTPIFLRKLFLIVKHHGRVCWGSLLLFLGPLTVMYALDTSGIFTAREDLGFQEYNKLRGWTIGFPSFDRVIVSSELQKINGWSGNDCQMFRIWLFFDEHKFSAEKMRNLTHLMRSVALSTIPELLRPSNLLNAVSMAALHWLWFRDTSFLFVFIVVALYFAGNADGRRGFVLVYFLWILVGVFLMVYFLRFPARVALPSFYCAALGAFLQQTSAFSLLPNSNERRLHPLGLIPILTMILFALAVDSSWRRLSLTQVALDAFAMDKKYLMNIAGDAYVLKTPVVPSQFTDPLTAEPLPKSEIGPGWLVFSRLFYRRLNEYGLARGADILPWMVNNRKAVLLLRGSELSIVQEYFRQNYRDQLAAVQAGQLPSQPDVKIYRLVSPKTKIDGSPL
jgi:hypothetical protein